MNSSFVCENDGVRLDLYLKSCLPEMSRSALQKLLDSGDVTVGSVIRGKNYKLKVGDNVCVDIPAPIECDIVPQNIPIEVVYEDDDIIVVNKSKGMVVHPAAGNPDGTLVNALLYHCKGNLSGINGELRPGIVHRIDKDTSGLLVVAKNDFAHNFLAEQIKAHSMTREYDAVVVGSLSKDFGSVVAPIGRSPRDRKKMAVTEKNSKEAITHFTVVKRYPHFTHIKCRLETGRTHQIRVHMAFIGHPVFGDGVYGKKSDKVEGQCLHAGRLGFVHPTKNEYMEFKSDLPEYFLNVIS